MRSSACCKASVVERQPVADLRLLSSRDMNADQDANPALDAARVEAVLSGLEELKMQLQAAGRSEFSAPEIQRSLAAFWHEHGPVLREVKKAVLESLRIQALELAYEWRKQLEQALAAQPGQPPRRPGAQAMSGSSPPRLRGG